MYLDLVIGVHDRHGRTSIFDSESLECARAVFRSDVAINALVLCGKCDTLAERVALSGVTILV